MVKTVGFKTIPKQKRSAGNRTNEKPRTGRTQAIIIGLVLAIVGSIVASSFEKGTLTNYAGFGMLLVGIAAFVVGACSLVSASVENRLRRESPDLCEGRKRLPLCGSIWAIGAGTILGVLGSLIAGTYDKNSILNTAGFSMLLVGICVLVLGVSSAALGSVKIELNQNKKAEVKTPRMLFFDVISLGLGVVFLVIGSIIAGSYEKESMLNYAGFGMLILGIAILSIGASGTAVAILKARFYSEEQDTDESRPRVIFGSIWALGIGAMLLIIGSILSGMYEKNSFMNYTGFAQLLAGTGVFIYGMFETAKISAMGYLSYRLGRRSMRSARRLARKQENRVARFRGVWRNLVRTSAVVNLAGIITAVCLLFFSLWQLDIIVSGPVWWSSSEFGQGYGWSHPNGAYSNDYFQCFFWKTTIGQAYDTLFMVIFISFIVMFASAFLWPRRHLSEGNFALKLSGQGTPPKRRRVKRKKLNLATKSDTLETSEAHSTS
jgi:hypothetical protein